MNVVLLIDPGIGTAPKPDAGPSLGQVPQVTLDERTHLTDPAAFSANDFCRVATPNTAPGPLHEPNRGQGPLFRFSTPVRGRPASSATGARPPPRPAPPE